MFPNEINGRCLSGAICQVHWKIWEGCMKRIHRCWETWGRSFLSKLYLGKYFVFMFWITIYFSGCFWTGKWRLATVHRDVRRNFKFRFPESPFASRKLLSGLGCIYPKSVIQTSMLKIAFNKTKHEHQLTFHQWSKNMFFMICYRSIHLRSISCSFKSFTQFLKKLPPLKTNMTLENPHFQ